MLLRSEYLVDSINPDLVVIQEALDRHTPRGQYCKFNTGAFMRSDTLTRYQAHKVGIDTGFLTPNEARALEELPPLPGGDELRPLTSGATAPAPAPVVVNNSPLELVERTTELHPEIVVPVELKQDATVVHVAAPIIEFQEAERRTYRRRVERDESGRIVAVIDEPGEN